MRSHPCQLFVSSHSGSLRQQQETGFSFSFAHLMLYLQRAPDFEYLMLPTLVFLFFHKEHLIVTLGQNDLGGDDGLERKVSLNASQHHIQNHNYWPHLIDSRFIV